ncbi:hypothetical protein FAZ69_00410 [Trinickia terrae]|uniref:Uncharacterized protein n=1 Tax=Trinickia terrae TaxID=2571161 RepID=A0A4U1IES6_9BURK|nr:hypothetical protein [Trinickia terrae]TKC92204.1 hypothetical protein FAZ69_00410 [Trinickia terrae]
MKNVRAMVVLATCVMTVASVSAFAGNGNGGGGGNGGGAGAGAGHGGLGGEAGGMSGSHMSSKGVSNTNSFRSSDRDFGLSRAEDRSDTQADRASAPAIQKGHLAHHQHLAQHADAHSRVTSRAHLHRVHHVVPDRLS